MPSSQTLTGFVYDAAGKAVSSADVKLYRAGTTTGALSSTVTNASGKWTFALSSATDSNYDAGAVDLDVQITNAATGTVGRIKFEDQVQVERVLTRQFLLSPDSNGSSGNSSRGFFHRLTGTAELGAEMTHTLPKYTGTFLMGKSQDSAGAFVLDSAQTVTSSAAATFAKLTTTSSLEVTGGGVKVNTNKFTTDSDGNTVVAGTLTVGADATSGTDVTFYSATSGDNFTWDASAKKLIITGTDGTDAFAVADGDATFADDVTITGDLTVSGTTTTINSTVTTYSDVLVKLGEGTTADPASAVIDLGFIFTRGNGSASNTANRAMLWDESEDEFAFAFTNDEDGETTGNVDIDDYADIRVGAITADDASTFTGVVTAGGFTIGSAAIVESELEMIDGVTAGTVAASKAVVVDANLDIGSFRNLTATGELDAATLDLSGAADIAGDLVLSGGADGALQFTNAGENSIKIPDAQASALIIEEGDNAYITFVTSDGSEAITVAKATTFSAGIANSGTIAAGTWNGTAIASGYIAADAITGAKIADDAVDSEHIAAGAIDNAHLADDAVDSDELAAGAVDTAHLAADVITGAKIADDAIDSEHYADGSIDNAHIANGTIALAKTALVAGTGITLSTNTLDVDAAQTGINSLLATDIKIGEDDETKVDFETADEIHFYAANVEQVYVADNIFGPQADSDVDLGTTGVRWKDAFVDSITVTGSVQAPTIDYTDGDLAMTIADGGGVTFAQASTFTGGLTLNGDANLAAEKLIKIGGTAEAHDFSTEHSGHGITLTMEAGETLTLGQAVYVDANGKAQHPDVDAASVTGKPAIGIAMTGASSGTSVNVMVLGIFRDTTYDFTPGAAVIMTGTDGALTTTAGDTAADGDIVQRVGIAITADMLFVMPSIDEIEHA